MCSGTCSVFNVNMLGITHFVFRCGVCVSMLVGLVNCGVNCGVNYGNGGVVFLFFCFLDGFDGIQSWFVMFVGSRNMNDG